MLVPEKVCKVLGGAGDRRQSIVAPRYRAANYTSTSNIEDLSKLVREL